MEEVSGIVELYFPKIAGGLGIILVRDAVQDDPAAASDHILQSLHEFRSLRHVDTLTAHLMFSAVPGDPICPQWIASTDYEAVFLHVEAGLRPRCGPPSGLRFTRLREESSTRPIGGR